MKTALYPIGTTKKHSFIVSEEDVAAFHGEVIHQVCATFTLAREIEYSSRLFVLDMKEDEEEGIGTSLTITHEGPAFVGEYVEITACLEKCSGNEVLCSYEVHVGDRRVASGSTGQKVFTKEKLKGHFDRISRGPL